MYIVDTIIILALILIVVRWAKIGFIDGSFNLAGLLGGLLIGVLLAPYTMRLANEPTQRFLIMILTVVAVVLVFSGILEFIGHLLSKRLKDNNIAIRLNSILGGIFGIVVAVILVWLGSNLLSTTPNAELRSYLAQSKIIAGVNDKMPPAPMLLSGLNRLITPLEFPKVFVGVPPKLAEPVAPTGSSAITQAVANAGKSTVRIESPGCGGILYGSGFIVGRDLVMTNAHVVAGSRSVRVVDTNSRRNAQVVYFDPRQDVAVLRVPGVSGNVLSLSSQIMPRGTKAVVMGFPGGGEFKAVSASVMRNLNANGLDIYQRATVARNVYELQAQVVKGNSGGPVVLPDGTVIGIVFAAAQDNSSVGYGVSSPTLRAIVGSVQNKFSTVSNGTCTEQI